MNIHTHGSSKLIMYMSPDQNYRCLLRAILANSVHANWSIQGFGMLRLYLNAETRLHLWNPDFEVENVSKIHNHPWHFCSTVIVGQLTNTIYDEVDECRDSFRVHKQRIKCGPGGCAVDSPMDTYLTQRPSKLFRSGDFYQQKSPVFHTTDAMKGTATIVTRKFNPDTEHADVCFPYGTSWVSAEPRRATQDQVEQFFTATLKLLDAQDEVERAMGFFG